MLQKGLKRENQKMAGNAQISIQIGLSENEEETYSCKRREEMFPSNCQAPLSKVHSHTIALLDNRFGK